MLLSLLLPHYSSLLLAVVPLPASADATDKCHKDDQRELHCIVTATISSRPPSLKDRHTQSPLPPTRVVTSSRHTVLADATRYWSLHQVPTTPHMHVQQEFPAVCTPAPTRASAAIAMQVGRTRFESLSVLLAS
jgi:hypothetical protein